MTGGKNPSRRSAPHDAVDGIRAAVNFEDVPLFILGDKGHEIAARELVYPQSRREIRVVGDSQYGLGNGFTQRLWLAILVTFDRNRRTDGLVFFTLAELLRIMRLDPNSGRNIARAKVALQQLDATRVYVRGEPLDGPGVDGTVRPARGSVPGEYKYAIFSDDGFVPEESDALTPHLRLVADDGAVITSEQAALVDQQRRTRRHGQASRRLGRYLTECLVGDVALGRIIPGWVFELESPYEVRLVRLVGRRANGARELRLGIDGLIHAMPCLAEDGTPMAPDRAIRRIGRACQALQDRGFLIDHSIDQHDVMTFTLADASTQRATATSGAAGYPPEVVKTFERLRAEADPTAR